MNHKNKKRTIDVIFMRSVAMMIKKEEGQVFLLSYARSLAHNIKSIFIRLPVEMEFGNHRSAYMIHWN